MTTKRMTDAELAEEARKWDSGEYTPAGWVDAPDGAPLAKETTAISLRLPKAMLHILKGFAQQYGIGYQVLIKKWLDRRIAEERQTRRSVDNNTRPVEVRQVIQLRSPTIFSLAASFDAQSVQRLSQEAVTEPLGLLAANIPSKN